MACLVYSEGISPSCCINSRLSIKSCCIVCIICLEGFYTYHIFGKGNQGNVAIEVKEFMIY